MELTAPISSCKFGGENTYKPVKVDSTATVCILCD